MKLEFFKIPVQESKDASSELNSFCIQHRISQIEKHFVADGSNSFWSICVTYLDTKQPLSETNNRKSKNNIDYKEVLNADDFSIYSQLRELRKTIAEQESTPLYNIFNNEQLAQIVQQRLINKKDLLAVSGIGQTRVDKYGELFIAKMKSILTTDKADTTQNE